MYILPELKQMKQAFHQDKHQTKVSYLPFLLNKPYKSYPVVKELLNTRSYPLHYKFNQHKFLNAL
jgi:hypothetical protein